MFISPGCPPTPAATLYGFAMALGLLEQKIHARGPGEQDEQPAEITAWRYGAAAARESGSRSTPPWQVIVTVVRLPMTSLTQLGQGEEQVARWLEAENDPRLNEIVSHLNHVVEEARIR